MFRSIRRTAFIAAGASASAFTAHGGTFAFTKVADTGQGYSSFTTPVINTGGDVAFTATLNGSTQVFKSTRVGGVSTVFTAAAAPTGGTLYFLGGTAINDAGQIAFSVTTSSVTGPPSALYRAGAGGVTQVSARAVTPGGGYVVGAIANDGTIYYQGSEDFPSAIRSDNGTTVYQISKAHAFTRPAVAANGSIATTLNFSNGVGGDPLRSDVERNGVSLGGAFTPSGDTIDPPRNLEQVSAPDINSAGDIYFAGGFGGGVTLMKLSASNAFSFVSAPALTGTLGAPAVNDAGTLVDLDSNGNLATGVNGLDTRVISIGDPLDGSTVTALAFEHDGLSESNLVAFETTLADGRTGIYTVAVPEPTAIAASAIGVCAVLTRHRRRA